MRTNIELKKEWLKKSRFVEYPQIRIVMMYAQGFDDMELSLNVDLYSEDKLIDTEFICVEYNTPEPSKDMLNKAKYLKQYFSKHFERVTLVSKVIIV